MHHGKFNNIKVMRQPWVVTRLRHLEILCGSILYNIDYKSFIETITIILIVVILVITISFLLIN